MVVFDDFNSVSTLQHCADSSASADMSDGDGTAVKLTTATAETKEGATKGSGVMGKILDFKQRRQQKTPIGRICFGITFTLLPCSMFGHHCTPAAP